MGSRAEHGSSSKRTSGSAATARAMQGVVVGLQKVLALSKQSLTSSHKAAPRRLISKLLRAHYDFSHRQFSVVNNIFKDTIGKD